MLRGRISRLESPLTTSRHPLVARKTGKESRAKLKVFSLQVMSLFISSIPARAEVALLSLPTLTKTCLIRSARRLSPAEPEELMAFAECSR